MFITTLLLSSVAAPVGHEPAKAPIALDETTTAWTGSVVLGFTKTSGNTDTQTYTVNADAVKRLEDERYTLRASYNKAEANNVDTEDNLFATGKYDYFVNERLYYLGIAGYQTDELARLDMRYYAGGGVGYQFVETEETKFGAEAALTFFSEEFTTGVSDDYMAARLASTLFHQYSETTRFDQTAEIFPSIEESSDVYGKLDNRVSVDVTENMFAQIQWVWDWDNSPAAGSENSDHRIVFGLGWTF